MQAVPSSIILCALFCIFIADAPPPKLPHLQLTDTMVRELLAAPLQPCKGQLCLCPQFDLKCPRMVRNLLLDCIGFMV